MDKYKLTFSSTSSILNAGSGTGCKRINPAQLKEQGSVQPSLTAVHASEVVLQAVSGVNNFSGN